MVRRGAAPIVHVVVGAVTFALLATKVRCGEDECLKTLALVVSASMWALTLAFIPIAGRRGSWLWPWAGVLLWLPIAWALTLVLFAAFPSLGNA